MIHKRAVKRDTIGWEVRVYTSVAKQTINDNIFKQLSISGGVLRQPAHTHMYVIYKKVIR